MTRSMTRTIASRESERGVAMLITMFALLLLTVIGLGMLVSASTESMINSNFRDKQTATFAAMAGLQEARDRIQPATLHINPPTGMPILTAGNVIYIINPRSGETIQPWNAGNRFRDTELCQLNILGLTGTPGVPCTTLPIVNTWYTVYDNSQTSAAPWNFADPLDYKWVRITLKSNNMTPVTANGDGTNSNQVCWDGNNQIVLPNGYGPECTRYGSVIFITVNEGGSGYVTPPTVTIDPPPSGVQATAVANLVPVTTDSVSSVTVTDGGMGYTAAPLVTLTGGGGTGATAVATYAPSGAPISSITLTDPGTRCYEVPPEVAFVGGGGSGAAATATLAASYSCLAGITITGSCNPRANSTVSGVNLTGGGGTGLSMTLAFGAGGVASVQSIEDPGTGYTSVPTTPTSLSSPGCNGLTATAVLGKRVQSVALTSGGNGYTSVPSVSFTTGTGTTASQPAATATLGPMGLNGTVTGVTVTSGGSGYTSAPTVTFTPVDANGAGATADANVGALTFRVGSITITAQGQGYTTDPAVTFSSMLGSGAVATATLGRGANYGKIYLMTALAQTRTGARSMIQMEATTPVTGFSPTGALNFAGPNPAINNMPSSANLWIRGNDADSCGQGADPLRPAIGAYDDPNVDPPTDSVGDIVTALPNPTQVVGEGAAPSVKNIFGSLGETLGTPIGLKALIDAVNAVKTNAGNTVNYGTAANPQINYIQGDVTLAGASSGYGVLVVTGTLTMSGNFTWYGPVLVVGDGILDFRRRWNRKDRWDRRDCQDLGRSRQSEPAHGVGIAHHGLERRRQQRHSVRSLLGDESDVPDPVRPADQHPAAEDSQLQDAAVLGAVGTRSKGPDETVHPARFA